MNRAQRRHPERFGLKRPAKKAGGKPRIIEIVLTVRAADAATAERCIKDLESALCGTASS